MIKRTIKKEIGEIFLRYVLILGLILISYSEIIYLLLLKVTIYPAGYILGYFYDLTISNSIIDILTNNQMFRIDIISACVAVSAYLLLIILNLSTRMNIRQRVYSIIFSILSLLIINILRIVVFTWLYLDNSPLFEILHVLTWYVLSIVIVVGLWFASVKLFGIDKIPIYDDFKYLNSFNKK